MIETEIQNLTAEIKKLRVALSDLNMPSPQTLEEEWFENLKHKREEIQATKEAQTEEAPSLTHGDIKAIMLKLSRESEDSDIKSKIKGILKVHGANKIQDLQAEQLPKVKTDLEELS